MYAEYDSEDGYDTMRHVLSNAYSRAYAKETSEEIKVRRKAEYEEMLLAKNFKTKQIQTYSKYDLMLMGKR
jgi:hypothetical protein